MAQHGQSGEGTAAPGALAELLLQAERCRATGRLVEAEAFCRRALEAQPNEPDAFHLLGLTAHQAGRHGEAIAHLQRAIKLAPAMALYHANLGEMCRLAGRTDEAVSAGRRALKLRPDYPEALSNLGIALYEQAAFKEAVECHRRAIALRPDFALAHSNLGNALHAIKRFDEAAASYRQAIALAPDFADAWSNLGITLQHAGCYEDGIAALRRAIALAPDHANAHSGLGILLLMRGDFGEGWEEYDWRLRSGDPNRPRVSQRAWQGESLAGRHIHVQAEQGLGDTLQFARYLPLLQARAGAVSMLVHHGLASLMRESLPGVAVFGDGGKPAPADCECALLSLPRWFRTRLETIPAAMPYLRPPAALAAHWRQALAGMQGLKAGLVWAGRPEHVNDFRRSLDLATLAPLLAVPGVSFASLQVGPRARDIKAQAPRKLDDLSPRLDDFAATAGAVAPLDLVITVDTAVAHLAGALGKPVWVLLPWVTDWRWLIGREDNPWYPTMRLFRQRQGEAWSDVVVRLASELAAAAQGDRSRLAPFQAAGERRAAVAADILATEAARALQQSVAPPPAPSAEPNAAEAAHRLALAAHQSGRLGEAIEHLRRAVAIDDRVALYHANLGEMHRLSGRPDLAADAARRALALDPGQPAALSNLGVALYEQKDYEGSLRAYDGALALAPDFADAHSNRGNALRALQRLAEAEAAYRCALARNPRFAPAWNNLGTTLRELKRIEEAEAAYRKALAQAPDDPDTLDNLALAVKDLDRLDEAVALLRRALALASRDPKLHLHLGSVLFEQHRIDEAAAAIANAQALDPNGHDGSNLLGRIAFERGQLDQSLAHFRRALALKPDLADALNNMGNVLKELGRLEEAQRAYLDALAIDPKIVGAYVNLADSKKFVAGDPHLAAMEALALEPLTASEEMQLHFGLGKAYADIKDHRRAFEHLLEGNARKRAQVAYDEAGTLALFARNASVFTPALIKQKSGHGDPSRLPIFVLGMPRSGTTLVEQILASHPRVHGAGELKAFNDIVDTVRAADGCAIPYPDFVPALDAAATRRIGAHYVAELKRLTPGVTQDRITDKMPSNFFFCGLIHLALPNAPIIHTVRDPVDTCVSCFSKLFTAEQSHTYDLAELGRYHRHYQALMALWHAVLPPGRILDVRYEEVVADLEGQARRIIAHCGLDWDPACLAFHLTDRPVRTASATQVRQPIYTGAIGRWRVYEPFLRPLLSELGL
jgi:tetratricopeptide (TPR) repeat protein